MFMSTHGGFMRSCKKETGLLVIQNVIFLLVCHKSFAVVFACIHENHHADKIEDDDNVLCNSITVF